MNASIWSFLAGCLSGSAETHFMRAKALDGLDAWRVVIRQINHGESIRFETLRRQVNELHNRNIKTLDAVEEDIESFENLLRDYHQAGGMKPANGETKSDPL